MHLNTDLHLKLGVNTGLSAKPNFIKRAYQNEELSNEEYFTLTGCLTSIMSVDNFVRSVIVPDESSKPLIEMFPPLVEKTHIAHKNRLHQFR